MNRLLAILIACLSCAAVAQFAPGPRRFNPWGSRMNYHYRLDESSGAFRDSLPDSTNNLTSVAGSVQTGLLGNCRAQKNSANYVWGRNSSQTAIAQIGGNFTITGWIWPTNVTDGWNGIVAYANAADSSGCQFGVAQAAQTLYWYSRSNGLDPGNALQTGNILKAGTWQMFAIWRDVGNNTKAIMLFGTNYPVGVLSVNTNARIGTGSSNITFGADRFGSNNDFRGMIDDVTKFDRVVPTNELLMIYNKGIGAMGYYAPQP